MTHHQTHDRSVGPGGGPPPPAAPPPGWWQASEGNWYPPQTPPAGYTTSYGYGLPVAGRTNGLAVAAMVLGILWIYWIGSILALVFGYVAKNQIDRSHGTQQGRGMAIAGIVLGWVGVGIFGFLMVVVMVGSTASS